MAQGVSATIVVPRERRVLIDSSDFVCGSVSHRQNMKAQRREHRGGRKSQNWIVTIDELETFQVCAMSCFNCSRIVWFAFKLWARKLGYFDRTDCLNGLILTLRWHSELNLESRKLRSRRTTGSVIYVRLRPRYGESRMGKRTKPIIETKSSLHDVWMMNISPQMFESCYCRHLLLFMNMFRHLWGIKIRNEYV